VVGTLFFMVLVIGIAGALFIDRWHVHRSALIRLQDHPRLHRMGAAAYAAVIEDAQVMLSPVRALKRRGGDVYWQLDARPMHLSRRTAMRLWEVSLDKRVSRAVGLADVETGDADFDARFRCWGTDKDVVRAVVVNAEVREALEELIAIATLDDLAVHPVGNFVVRVRARKRDIDDRRVVDRSLDLVRALQLAAFDQPTSARPRLKESGLGAHSGLPVGVPATS
jgi:hypothetical protein